MLGHRPSQLEVRDSGYRHGRATSIVTDQQVHAVHAARCPRRPAAWTRPDPVGERLQDLDPGATAVAHRHHHQVGPGQLVGHVRYPADHDDTGRGRPAPRARGRAPRPAGTPRSGTRPAQRAHLGPASRPRPRCWRIAQEALEQHAWAGCPRPARPTGTAQATVAVGDHHRHAAPRRPVPARRRARCTPPRPTPAGRPRDAAAPPAHLLGRARPRSRRRGPAPIHVDAGGAGDGQPGRGSSGPRGRRDRARSAPASVPRRDAQGRAPSTRPGRTRPEQRIGPATAATRAPSCRGRPKGVRGRSQAGPRPAPVGGRLSKRRRPTRSSPGRGRGDRESARKPGHDREEVDGAAPPAGRAGPWRAAAVARCWRATGTPRQSPRSASHPHPRRRRPDAMPAAPGTPSRPDCRWYRGPGRPPLVASCHRGPAESGCPRSRPTTEGPDTNDGSPAGRRPLVLHVIPTPLARGAQREARALADDLDRPGVRHHRVLSLFDGSDEVVADRPSSHRGAPPGRRVRRPARPAGCGPPSPEWTRMWWWPTGASPSSTWCRPWLGRRRPLAYYAIGTYSGLGRGPRPAGAVATPAPAGRHGGRRGRRGAGGVRHTASVWHPAPGGDDAQRPGSRGLLPGRRLRERRGTAGEPVPTWPSSGLSPSASGPTGSSSGGGLRGRGRRLRAM